MTTLAVFYLFITTIIPLVIIAFISDQILRHLYGESNILRWLWKWIIRWILWSIPYFILSVIVMWIWDTTFGLPIVSIKTNIDIILWSMKGQQILVSLSIFGSWAVWILSCKYMKFLMSHIITSFRSA